MRNYLIGSYAPKGCGSIYRLEVDNDNLDMRCTATYSCAENPSYLLMHPNGKIIYAVEERVPDGSLAVLELCGEKIVHLASMSSGGSAPCHLALDDTARYLFVSNYMSGSLAVYLLDGNGIPLRMTDLKQHSGRGHNLQRQEGPHVHSAWYHDGKVYVCDLGLDKVFCYELDRENGTLADTKEHISTPAGSGPRHSCYVPEFPTLLYIDCELSGEVLVWDLAEQRIKQCLRAVPSDMDAAWLSAIKARNDRMYVSNRGVDSFAVFHIGEGGILGARQICAHAYKCPRDFWPEKEYLLCADQHSHQVSLLSYDEDGTVFPQRCCVLYPASPTFILPL